jgi:nitric oxide reductase NorQ protein
MLLSTRRRTGVGVLASRRKAKKIEAVSVRHLIPFEEEYIDWNNSLEILQKAYEAKTFVMIVGSKGTGKTALVRHFVNRLRKPLHEVSFSLRTRESHLIGTRILENGTTGFAEGILVRSMRTGGVMYIDEINCADADMLIRFDEAFDDRRQIVLKENGGEVVKAKDDWFVIATINPLSHSGTKELPPQMVSRFPIRIHLGYPPPDIEKRIIRLKTGVDSEDVDKAIQLASRLRELTSRDEMYYSPSIRETIAFARLVGKGVTGKDAARLVFANVYYQYGTEEVDKVNDLIGSIFGYETRESTEDRRES